MITDFAMTPGSVIDGLEYLIVKYAFTADEAQDIGNAINFIKAHHPSLMTVEEVQEWVSTPRINRKPIFIECNQRVKYGCYIVGDMYQYLPDSRLCSDTYGMDWRCWTSEPSQLQKEATPWNSHP